MAERGQITWSQLRVGLFVLAGAALVIVAVFYVTGAGVLGAKYRLVTYLPDVSGLAVGDPVSLDGVQVGNVEAIRISPMQPGQTPDLNRDVEVVMKVGRGFQQYIRSDSTVGLVAQGFVGDRVATIQRGYTGRILQDGEEVPGKAQNGIAEVAARAGDLMESLNKLSAQISDVVGHIQRGEGTLGKLVVDQSAYNHLNTTLEHVDDLVGSVQRGQGTVGKLLTSDELYNRANSLTGRLDDVLAAVQGQKGSLGKLVYDPAIHDGAKQFLDNTNATLADIRAGRGTLGKLATDDSLFNAYRDTGQNLRELTAKLNSNQSTAGKLLNDPQLYDNLVGLTGDARLLMNEFRQNPKKFLRIRFAIF